MAETIQSINGQMIHEAFDAVAEGLAVTGIESVWAPVGQADTDLAERTSRELLTHIEKNYPDIDQTTKDVLVKFGTAAGALSMRLLFQPFQSDQIRLTYS